MNYCITTWHAGNAVLLNQTPKQCNKIFRSIFYRDKFFKVDDVYRNYGRLQVNDLFKFHAACFAYKHVITTSLLVSKILFLELAILDFVKPDNPTTYICPHTKNLFSNKLSHFLELKFGMLCPEQSEA